MSKHTSNYTAREFERKFKEEPLPSAFYALARNALGPQRDELGVAVSEETRSEMALLPVPSETLEQSASDLTAAVTWLLFYLRCPSKLREYIDILLGMAGNSTRLFPAPDVVVGICARQGVLPPQQEDPEKETEALDQWVEEQLALGENARNAQGWASRRRKLLDAFQKHRNFEFIKIVAGDFDPAICKNRPTQYQVHLLAFAAETVQRARASHQWSEESREKAIRQAARELILDIPESPPIEVREERHMNDEELLNRHLKMMEALAAKCRNLIRKHDGDLESVFEPALERLRRIAYEPVLGYSEEDERGTENVVPVGEREAGEGYKKNCPPRDEEEPGNLYWFPTAEPPEQEGDIKSCTPPGAEVCPKEQGISPSDEKVVSTLKEEGDTTSSKQYRTRLRQIGARVAQAQGELARRHPAPDRRMKERGCTEIVWGAVTGEAEESERRLDEAMIAYAEGEATDAEVEAAWREYVRVRTVYWKSGVLQGGPPPPASKPPRREEPPQ